MAYGLQWYHVQYHFSTTVNITVLPSNAPKFHQLKIFSQNIKKEEILILAKIISQNIKGSLLPKNLSMVSFTTWEKNWKHHNQQLLKFNYWNLFLVFTLMKTFFFDFVKSSVVLVLVFSCTSTTITYHWVSATVLFVRNMRWKKQNMKSQTKA